MNAMLIEDLNAETIVTRIVDDPYISDAELAEQRRRHPDRAHMLGKVKALSNEVERIGALIYIRRRLAHHEQAAARFKADYEALFGLQPGALDMSSIRVDGGKVTADDKMVNRIHRGRRLVAVIEVLGPVNTNRVVAAIVLASPISERVDQMPSGPNRRQVVTEVHALLDALDTVAEEYGFKVRGRAA